MTEANMIFAAYKAHPTEELRNQLALACQQIGRATRLNFPRSDRVNGELFDFAEQEAIFKVFEQAREVDPERFTGWYRAILRHKLIDVARGLKTVKRGFGSVSTERLVPDVATTHDHHDDLGELRAKILKSLRNVPGNQLEALCLFLEGHSYPEIAEMLHVPKGSISSRMHHVRQVLEPIWPEASEYHKVEGVQSIVDDIRGLIERKSVGVAV